MSELERKSVFDACEAQAHFIEILERIEKGEEITVTRDGTPVARLIPDWTAKRVITPEERAEAIWQWREISKGLSLGGLKIRDLINEGRR
jgi:prevent-host-death family protein